MPELVDNLANLTAHKDRDDLEVALVSTIQDLLAPQQIDIVRGAGELGNERWFTCARLDGASRMPITIPIGDDPDSLPAFSDFPLRVQCVTSQKVVRGAGPQHVTLFPLALRPDSTSVLEIQTATALADDSVRLISAVLRLYNNFQNLLDYGERDTLTELLNRKTFDGAFLKATIEQTQAAEPVQDERRDVVGATSFYLAMIDIDHFKRVNDTYGHLIGDEVLLLLARLMRACFRTHDQLYRFGGEEFVVLMRCKSEEDARQALERMRTSAENHPFPQVGLVTISVGFSQVRNGDTPSGAFERADKAVYHAKASGRNQVCSYAKLVEQGLLTEQAGKVGDMELF